MDGQGGGEAVGVGEFVVGAEFGGDDCEVKERDFTQRSQRHRGHREEKEVFVRDLLTKLYRVFVSLARGGI